MIEWYVYSRNFSVIIKLDLISSNFSHFYKEQCLLQLGHFRSLYSQF